MIIEAGQVWKKPTRDLLLSIDKVEGNKVWITVEGLGDRVLHVDRLINSLQKHKYFLLSDLTKALL